MRTGVTMGEIYTAIHNIVLGKETSDKELSLSSLTNNCMLCTVVHHVLLY